jgi:hypothetical protein
VNPRVILPDGRRATFVELRAKRTRQLWLLDLDRGGRILHDPGLRLEGKPRRRPARLV